MVVWAGLSNSQSIGHSYTIISKRLKITTLKTISIFLKLKLNECIFGAVIFEVIKMTGQKLEIEV